MSHITVDFNADDETIKRAILVLEGLLSPKPEVSGAVFKDTPATSIPAAPAAPIALAPAAPIAPATGIPAPVVPIASAVPAAVPAAPAVPVAPVEVDKAGFPWDKRIHASTKTKTAKDIWKKRKGVDAKVFAKVQAELSAAMKVSEPGWKRELPAAPVVGAPVAPVATAGVPAAPVVPVAAALTWPELLHRITDATQAGTINQEASNQFLVANGITGGLALLASREDLFEAYAATVGI